MRRPRPRRRRAARDRSDSRRRSGCGCSASPASASRASAELADEDVDRAVAVRHRVAPDTLVDRLALEHLARPSRRAPAAARTRAGSGRGWLPATNAWKRSARISSSPSDKRARRPAAGRPGGGGASTASTLAIDLLGVTGLGDPVVDAEPQAAHPLGDGRALGADDDAEVGKHPADPLEVVPSLLAEHGRVDQRGRSASSPRAPRAVSRRRACAAASRRPRFASTTP